MDCRLPIRPGRAGFVERDGGLLHQGALRCAVRCAVQCGAVLAVLCTQDGMGVRRDTDVGNGEWHRASWAAGCSVTHPHVRCSARSPALPAPCAPAYHNRYPCVTCHAPPAAVHCPVLPNGRRSGGRRGAAGVVARRQGARARTAARAGKRGQERAAPRKGPPLASRPPATRTPCFNAPRRRRAARPVPPLPRPTPTWFSLLLAPHPPQDKGHPEAG